MGKAFLKNTADLLQKKHKRKQWQKIMISLSLVVALLTSCLLIHPAITMSRQATCGQEEHTHTEKCYEKKLICNKEEQSISESSETEGEESVEAHTHSDACYENVLICGKQEHTHSEACYPKEEEKKEEVAANTEEEKSEDKDVKSEDQEDKAEEKTEDTEKAEARTLKVDQADYTVEVDCPAEANIPKDAKLKVREIKTGTAEYNGYYEKAQKAVASGDETDISFARFFDISFEVDGKEIEPEAKVEVKITYDDKVEVPEKGKVKSVHFGNKTEVLDVKTNEKNGKMDEVKFNADSFSVYAILGTEKGTEDVEGKTDTLTKTLDNITFNASYSADAGLPDGTDLVIKNVDAKDYTNATKDALGDVEIVGEKYFDISFEYNGKKIEPKTDVDVTITLSGDDAFTEGNGVKVVHFADGDETPEVINASVSGGKAKEASAPAKANILQKAVRALALKKTESVITFKSSSFSVYGVVETEDEAKNKNTRRTYKFTNDDRQPYKFTLNKNPEPGQVTPDTDEQIVKNGDTLADVGIPVSTVDSKREFIGWAVVSGDGTLGTPFKLPTTINDITGNTDQIVTLRAVYSDQIKITFYDVNNKTILHTIKATPESTLDLSRYEAVPARADQGFLGWAITANATEALSNSYTVPSSDISLYPVIATGHWLRFDKNDKNDKDDDPTEATYTSPVFVTGAVDKSSDKPNDPTRTGYAFGGWYEKNNEGVLSDTEYSFSGELTESKTLYAKWIPNKVTYRVVYWEENPDDYGFSYYRSGELTGTAGTTTSIGTIDLTDADGNAVRGFHHHSSTEEDRTDKDHLAHTTKDVVIKGDGTTVVNVYFDRDIYTVKFVNRSNATEATYNQSNSGDYYYVNNTSRNRWYLDQNGRSFKNGYYKIGEPAGSNSRISSSDSNQVTFTYYTRTGNLLTGYNYTQNTGMSSRYAQTGGSDGTIEELTIPAKYGADIANQWPSRRTGLSTTYPVNWAVTTAGASGEMQANISTMPLDGATYYYIQEGSTYTFKEVFYTQNISGGDVFTRDHTDTIRWNGNLYTSRADYYDLRGFTPIFGSKDEAGDVSNYVLGTTIPTIEHVSVKVGTSIGDRSNYDSNDNSYKVNFYYARNQYEIDFTPNDGKSDFMNHYYYQASIANAAPTDYVKGETTIKASNGDTLTFAGWYDNPDGLGDEYVFTGKTMPANNIHLYGKWVPTSYTFTVDPNQGKFADGTTDQKITEQVLFGTVISEDDYRNPTRDGYEFIGWYKQNEDGTETVYDFSSPVTGNVNLIAHWRKTGSFGVRYINTDPTKTPVKDGDQLKVDPNSYADQAEAKVLEAPTSDQIPKGYEFIGWSDGTNSYAPGDTITLDASKAEKHTVDGKEGQYITLKATYTKLNTTWLKYDANGGTGNLSNPDGITDNQQVNIPMNTQVTLSSGAGFTRTGYKLIGWNTKADGTGMHWDLSDKAGVDGVEGNTLYVEWAPVYVTVSFTKKGEQSGTEETKVLAGAQFSLTTETYTKSATSDENGSVSFTGENAVQAPTTEAGKIQLSETSAPNGYDVAQGSPWTVTYDVADAKKASDGKYYVAGTIKSGETTITEIIDAISKTDITIVKEDQSGNKITGASFTLKFKGKDGTKDTVATATSGLNEGKFTIENESGVEIEGLPVGQYVLTETKAPDGYIINTSDVEFTVTKDGVTVKEGIDTKLAIASGKTLTVKNTPGQALPNTGGSGTLPYTLGGIALIMASALMYGFRMRRRERRLN